MNLTIARHPWFFMMILLIGCAPLPHPSHTDTESWPKTRSGQIITLQTTDFSHLKWWTHMHDSDLNRLMKKALKTNLQLHTARANILQAQAQLKEAHFAWLPTLNATGNGFIGGGWDTSFTPQGPFAQNSALSHINSLHFRGAFAGFVPTYSLNVLANIQQTKFASASLRLQKAIYNATKLSLISQVTGAYFRLIGQKEQRAIQTLILQDLQQLYHLEKARLKAGAHDASTLLSIEQQLAAQKAALSTLDNSIAQVENALQVLINHNPGPLKTHNTLFKLSSQALIPARLPSAVLKNRPDLIMAEETLNLSESSLGLAYANFFPTISLTGLLGSASLELRDLLKLSTSLWVAEGLASLPVVNGANYAAIKAAKAGYYAAYYTYLQTVKTVFQDVDDSLTQQQQFLAVYKDQARAQQACEKNYRLMRARLRAGATDESDVLNAQLAKHNAQLALILAKMQHLDSLVALYQALGGGYLA